MALADEALEENWVLAAEGVGVGWLYVGGSFIAPLPMPEPAPEEVSMGQCRLALFDLHGIATDAQFYALADILPEEARPRARLQLSTRQSVRYDNELVIAICEANGWDREALFVHGALQ